MKRSIILSLFVFSSIGLFAQSEVRDLAPFTALHGSTGIKIDLQQCNEHSATVSIGKGELSDIITNVEGNTLYVKLKSKMGWNTSSKGAKVTLCYQDLNEISASSGTSIQGKEIIKAENFVLNASSGASVSVNLDVEKLRSDLSSGSSVKVEGSSQKHYVDVSSGASYKATEMISQYVDAEASSGGAAKVHATKELEAEASSGGAVGYKGNPEKTDIDVGKYSGGSVRKM